MDSNQLSMYVALGQYQENYSILFLKPLAIKLALAVLARNEAVRKNPQRLYSEYESFLP